MTRNAVFQLRCTDTELEAWKAAGGSKFIREAIRLKFLALANEKLNQSIGCPPEELKKVVEVIVKAPPIVSTINAGPYEPSFRPDPKPFKKK